LYGKRRGYGGEQSRGTAACRAEEASNGRHGEGVSRRRRARRGAPGEAPRKARRREMKPRRRRGAFEEKWRGNEKKPPNVGAIRDRGGVFFP
jgi:hypothetical protein